MSLAALPRLTVRQLSRLLASGAINSEQLCCYCLTLAESGEDLWRLHAFSQLVSKEELVEHARESDLRRRKGETLSILDGIPVSVKANIATAAQPLTAASRILGADNASTLPVGYDATVVSSLIEHGGAILIGKTNMDEFGMGSLGTHGVSAQGEHATRNPLPFLQQLHRCTMPDEKVVEVLSLPAEAIQEAHDRVKDVDSYFSAGGSSCGSAASVSHGSSILSLGSDTGGSVRLPAAWCGVTGLKPSYGALSRHGLVSYASSLDTIGCIGPTADCVALLFQHLYTDNHEPDRDATLSPAQESVTSSIFQADERGNPLSGTKVGIPAAFSVEECPAVLRDAWSRIASQLDQLGASVDVVDTNVISPEVVQLSLAAYYVLVSAEASSNLARYDGFRYGASVQSILDAPTSSKLSLLEQQYAATRTRGFGREVARRVLCGTSVLSSDRFHTFYEAAAKLRAEVTIQMHQALNDYDLLLVPTAVFPPVDLGEEMDQTEMFANDVMTVPVSLAGLPAVSIPAAKDDNDGLFTPAFQLVGARLKESTILRAAIALENKR